MSFPSSITEEASHMVSDYRDHKRHLRRDRHVYLAAASLLLAYERDYPTTLSEVCNHYDADRKLVARAKRSLSNTLNRNALPPPPASYIERYTSELSLPSTAIEGAQKIAETRVPNGHHPSIVAAAAIYMATRGTDNSVTQEEMADVANTHPGSIRKCYAKFDDTQ